MSTQSNRIAKGGQVNRAKPVTFTFDNKTYQGFEGDTLASALLANGVKLMGRSFKYHRARGVLTAGSEEPNALVELRSGARREPNTRATTIELFDGLSATSQNRFPSLSLDFMSVNQLFGRFLVAGFYYKTFMWPVSFWESFYEKIIRRSAGLGRAATQADPDSYDHAHAHCDVLVVGAGPAGLGAALSAGRAGARVIMVEENPWFGGGLNLETDIIDEMPAAAWVEAAVAELDALENVKVMNRTVLFGYYDDNVMAALERLNDHVAEPVSHQPRQRLWTFRANQVVIATGAQERPIVFDNNDKPGVMLSSAVRTYVDRFGVAPGKKVAIVTNNDDAYKTAFQLHEAGIKVAVIADARKSGGELADKAQKLGIRVETDCLPRQARGYLGVSSLVLQRSNADYLDKIACDCIAVSGGYSPNVHLVSQSGVRPVWDESILGFVPDTPLRPERSAGACKGTFDLAGCLRQGYEAGLEAAAAAGIKISKKLPAPHSSAEPKSLIVAVWRSPGTGKAFVDFQNDVTAGDIELAHREGMVSIEHSKRYTTLGMATDQGKTSNVNGLALLAIARGEDIPTVGTTRYRPPYSPVAIAAFAGHERGKNFQPTRLTAMHRAHERMGAVFVEVGQWLRPRYYPISDTETMTQAIWREADMVRKTAGMCDVSTLGKIEVFGADAAEFLNRLYINGFAKLPVGKARYGLMLREDGHVFDDGTTSRLAEDHYFMTTTTANAAGVLSHMDYCAQVLWPQLDVAFCSATEQWCGVAVAGPQARHILKAAFGDALDMSDEALPFMGVREFEWNGAQARIFRISFSGELAFEVNVPWGYGEAMWDHIFAAGQEFGMIAYGTEALGVLRIEKGHVAGNELDGRTTAQDMGLGRMMSSKKSYIGLPLSQREGMANEERPRLVGLKPVDIKQRLRGGAHLVDDKNNANLETSLGWVTSVADSPAMGSWIGLAYLRHGPDRHGERISAVYPLRDEVVEVEICDPVFFDAKGERLHG